MNKGLLFCYTIVVILSSCINGKTVKVEGQVNTFGTNSPITHPPVKVYFIKESGSGTILSGSIIDTIDMCWTDNYQRFAVEGKVKNSEWSYIGIDRSSVRNGYGYYSNNLEKDVGNDGGKRTINLSLFARGFVRVYVKRSPNSPYKGIDISMGSYQGTHSGNVDISFKVKYLGNTNVTISMRKWGASDPVYETVDVFVPAKDTAFFNLEF